MTEVTLYEEDGILMVEMRGDVVLSDVNALKEKVKAFVGDRNAFRLLIQMQGVEFIDSSGLGMLISWYKLANERESKIVYCCIGDYVRKIMGIAKLDKILPLAENKAQAKEMLE